MENNVIKVKTFEFALKVLVLYKDKVNYKNRVLFEQLLRSATSVGANVEESIGGYSRKDFKSKISISYKEARESRYWLRLLKEGKLCDFDESYLINIDEICKILGKILSTLKTKY